MEELVNRSANYLLFLTAEVLQRPAVLVEICAAHVARKNIIPVMVDFPGALGGGTDARQFIFPHHLEQAIEELRGAEDSPSIELKFGTLLVQKSLKPVDVIKKFDIDNNGSLSVEELEDALVRMKMPHTGIEVEGMVYLFDLDRYVGSFVLICFDLV